MVAASSEYLSDRVHQATGMISVQLGCTMRAALDRLRVVAGASDLTLDETAAAVIDRTLRFET